MIIRFSSDADAELAEARQWYAHQRENLDLEFMDSVDEALTRIVRNPHLYPIDKRKFSFLHSSVHGHTNRTWKNRVISPQSGRMIVAQQFTAVDRNARIGSPGSGRLNDDHQIL